VITSTQIQEARNLLGWSRERLSAHSSVSHSTIWRIETVGKEPRNSWFIEALQSALEEAGVEFTNGDQPGVRMKRQEVR
jgi:ribosome-binding protein aMBF1 (putative translation factor)